MDPGNVLTISAGAALKSIISFPLFFPPGRLIIRAFMPGNIVDFQLTYFI
jgi:hypothetical protein